MKPILFFLLSVLMVRADLIRGEVELAGLKGEIVFVSAADGQSRNLVVGDALREDDELTTPAGSSAELMFSNGVRIVVTPGTTIKLSIFRQVKMPSTNRSPNGGELSNEGSVIDLSLKNGSVTVICPSLQSRSMVSVRTPQGRSDLTKEGVYELGFNRVASGELATQSMVLSGALVFVPAGKGPGKSVTVESGNSLLATSEVSAPSQLTIEKTKMTKSEVEALTKALTADLPVVPLPPKPAPKPGEPVVKSVPGVIPGVFAGPAAQEQVIQEITKQIVERLVEANPSPAGG